jgi:hypothetical protein
MKHAPIKPKPFSLAYVARKLVFTTISLARISMPALLKWAGERTTAARATANSIWLWLTLPFAIRLPGNGRVVGSVPP